MKKECKNPYIKSQCKMMLSSLTAFESGMEVASKKDDGRTDQAEERLIKEIEKDIERLKKTLSKYI